MADYACPDAPEIAADGLPAEAGTLTVSIVGNAPDWLVPGESVALQHGLDLAPVTVASVGVPSDGRTIVTFTTALPKSFPAQSRIYPTVDVDLLSATATAHTSEFAEMDWHLAVRPGEDEESFGTPPAAWDERELWMRRPNWVTPPSLDFQQPIERVDYGVGAIGRYAPIKVAPRITQFSHLAVTRDESSQFPDHSAAQSDDERSSLHPVPGQSIIAALDRIKVLRLFTGRNRLG